MTLKKSSTPKSNPKSSGTLIIIGGAEDKLGGKEILTEVARRTGNGKLIVASVASELPDEMWATYKKLFNDMGIKKVEHLGIDRKEETRLEKNVNLFDDQVKTVFFTGGDQLKITTKLGGTEIARRIFSVFGRGGIIAGTSAGASMMGESMLLGGENQESHKVGNWMMAPGIGLLKETIIDQHFAQRGRIGRLLGAVSLNPGVLGVGIDEDTGIIVENESFKVIGSSAVYIIDGRGVSYTNISEAEADRAMSMHDVRLHILSNGEHFDIKTRRPRVDPKIKR